MIRSLKLTAMFVDLIYSGLSAESSVARGRIFGSFITSVVNKSKEAFVDVVRL